MITLDHEQGMIYIGDIRCTDQSLSSRLKMIGSCVYHLDRYLLPETDIGKLRSALYDFSDDIVQTDRFKRLVLLEKAGKLGVQTKDIQLNLLEIGSDLVIEVGPNQCRIKGSSVPSETLDKSLKYFLKTAVNMQIFKRHKWDGYVHLYDVRKNLFPTGLLSRVCVILEARDITYEVRGADCLVPPARVYDWTFTDQMVPMPDQVECINAILAQPQCTIKCPTGFGKTSLIASRTIADFGLPSVYIANQNLLLYQAMEEFSANIIGVGKVGIIGDGQIDIQPVTVASIQTLAKAFKVNEVDEIMANHLQGALTEAMASGIPYGTFLDTERDRMAKYAARKSLTKVHREVGVYYLAKLNKMIRDCRSYKKVYRSIAELKLRVDQYRSVREYLTQTVKYIFFDECQSLGTDIWKLVTQQTGAPVRIAASATPKREDGADLEIEAASGPKVYEVSAGELISLGRLAEIEVEFVPFDHMMTNDTDGVTVNEAEDEYIVANEQRNQLGIDLLRSLLDEQRSIIILTKRVEHGERLLQMCIDQGVGETRHIHGATHGDYKKTALSEFGAGVYRVLIASTILDVGINLPRASGLVLMGAGSSEIRGPQRLGRIIRLFKLDPGKIARAYDILDQNVPFFERQAWRRYRNYCSEFERKRISVRGDNKGRKLAKESIAQQDVDCTEFDDQYQAMAEDISQLFNRR